MEWWQTGNSCRALWTGGLWDRRVTVATAVWWTGARSIRAGTSRVPWECGDAQKFRQHQHAKDGWHNAKADQIRTVQARRYISIQGRVFSRLVCSLWYADRAGIPLASLLLQHLQGWPHQSTAGCFPAITRQGQARRWLRPLWGIVHTGAKRCSVLLNQMSGCCTSGEEIKRYSHPLDQINENKVNYQIFTSHNKRMQSDPAKLGRWCEALEDNTGCGKQTNFRAKVFRFTCNQCLRYLGNYFFVSINLSWSHFSYWWKKVP